MVVYGRLSMGGLGAFGAQTVKCQVRAFHAGAVPAFEILLNGGQGRVFKLDHKIASSTQEMVVLAGQHWVETVLASIHIEAAGAHQAFLFQPVQRAIDGRKVQAGVFLAGVCMELLGRWVRVQVIQSGQDQGSLGGHAPAAGLQALLGFLEKVGCHRMMFLRMDRNIIANDSQ
jgi:hypothetical protein